jgi:hypothetical protein
MSRCGDILDAERCGCILGHLESVTSEELQQLVAALGTQQTQGELSEDLSKRVAKASKPCFKDPFEEGFG